MPRNIDALVVTASEADLARPIIMAELHYPSGVLRVHTGVADFTLAGATWVAIGALGQISGIQEDVELQASGLKLTLSGIDQDNIARTLEDNYQGQLAVIYLALLDADHQIIGAPCVLFQGRMDSHEITLGQNASISVTVENALRAWDVPRERRYNNEDQKAFFPNDLGMEFVPQATSKPLYWGGPTPKGQT